MLVEEDEMMKAIPISAFKCLLLTKGRSSRPVLQVPSWYANYFKLERAWPQRLLLQTVISHCDH